jgi:hypothetical protein
MLFGDAKESIGGVVSEFKDWFFVSS